MKKITLILLLAFTFNFTFSQVLFEDDFDGSGPGLVGWTLNNVDGLTPDANVAQFTDAWIQADDPDNVGDMVAQSTSWYAPAGTADDWMITPAITLTGNSVLTWDEEAQDDIFPDGYEVLLSTGTTALVDFTNVLYTTAAASGAVWTTQTADLTAYTGQTVYIAWRNNSTDQFILLINNVKVEIPPTFDTAITVPAAAQDQYTQIPLEQIAVLGTDATIDNIGSAVTNAIATVTVTDGIGTVYTESSSAFSIGAGANQAVTFTGYLPTAADTYTTTYTVTTTETDGNLLNNTVVNNTEVTANTYARDDNTPTGALGIGAGPGQLGQMFDVLVVEDILSVTFTLAGSIDLPGTTTFVTVWDMVGGIPNAVVAQTDPVTISATNDGVNPPETYTANITGGPFTLSPGQYLIALEEGAFSLTISTTTNIFTPGTTWINFPTIPTGTWANNEDFAFNVSYMIRANFQDNTLGVENFDLEDITISLYPNPASNQVTIVNPNQVALEKATITDVTGRVIKTYDLNGTSDAQRTIDVSSLSSANYFMTITSSHGAVVKQFVIK